MAPGAPASRSLQTDPHTGGLTAALTVAAGLVTLAGTAYALFGPLVSTNGESISHYEDGLVPVVWLVFAGWAVGGGALIAAGAAALARDRRAGAIPLTIILGATLVNVLAWFTVLTVGYLVLPGAILAAVAAILAYWRYA